LRWQKQVFVHTRLSRAYLALARLSCSYPPSPRFIRSSYNAHLCSSSSLQLLYVCTCSDRLFGDQAAKWRVCIATSRQRCHHLQPISWDVLRHVSWWSLVWLCRQLHKIRCLEVNLQLSQWSSATPPSLYGVTLSAVPRPSVRPFRASNLQIRGLRVKGQGHWERKCKIVLRAYLRQKWID